ncbi:MAG: hypothetical protein QOF24_1903 [Verrucomicrobiota bacterium]|jgi:hypothetical protein
MEGGHPGDLPLLGCRHFLREVFSFVTIFDNAIMSLQLALEDFSANSDPRLLSAVRNLHAGILLLYKAGLVALSPAGSDEVLIKREVHPKRLPSGEIVFVGRGKKTVDVSQIKSRFESLGVETDWKRFEKISGLRNDIEHYSTILQRDTIRGMIADTFVIVRDFVTDELGQDPKLALGAGAWNTLMSVSEVFEKERNDCHRRLGEVDWQSAELSSAMLELPCGECGSQLMVPVGGDRTTGVQCRSCDEVEGFESCAERALSEHLGWQNHSSLQDGGDEVLITCPFCFQESYVVDEASCAICEESCEHTCALCANPIPTSELSDGSLCGYCGHMVNKDD